MRNDLKAKICLIIKLILGLALIGLALYVIISGILNKEDGNLLVNSVLFLMLLAGVFLIYKAIKITIDNADTENHIIRRRP